MVDQIHPRLRRGAGRTDAGSQQAPPCPEQQQPQTALPPPPRGGGLNVTAMRHAYIGLGANQGDLEATLNAAVQSLGSLEQSELVAASPFYRPAPIDAGGPDYLNAVVCIDTELEPYGLLLHLLEIEMVFGRKRRAGADARRNAP